MPITCSIDVEKYDSIIIKYIEKQIETDYDFIIIDDLEQIFVNTPHLGELLSGKIIHEKKSVDRFILLKQLKSRHEKKIWIIKDRRDNQLLASFTPLRTIKLTIPGIILEKLTELGKKFEVDPRWNQISTRIWKSLDFITTNFQDYEKWDKIAPLDWLEILFRLKRTKNSWERNQISDSSFFLFCVLMDPGLIREIYEDPNLLQISKILDMVLKNIFKSDNLCQTVKKTLISPSLEKFFHFILICAYLTQFFKNIQLDLSKFKIIDASFSNFEILQIISSSDIEILCEISREFLDKIVEIKKFINSVKLSKNSQLEPNETISQIYSANIFFLSEKLEQNMPFWRKIKDFENSKLLNTVEPNGKSFFFPDIDINQTHNSDYCFLKKLARLNYSYISLEEFGLRFLKLLSYRSPNGEYTLKKPPSIFRDFFPEMRYLLNLFKKNIFFQMGSDQGQYEIHINFLRNLFELANLWNDIENFDIKPLNINDFSVWTSLFYRYISPLDIHLNDAQESLRQFLFQNNEYRYYLKMFETAIKEKICFFNSYFKCFLETNYPNWTQNPDDNSIPLNVTNVIKRFFLPVYLDRPNSLNLFLIIDGCRMESWDILKQRILDDFPNIEIKTEIGLSILPSSTKWARLAFFAGDYYLNISSSDEANELKEQLRRNGKNISGFSPNNHFKTNCENIFDFEALIPHLIAKTSPFLVAIFNFSDKTSHTFDQSFVRELLNSIYESRIRPLINTISEEFDNFRIFFSTDHGFSQCTDSWTWGDPIFDQFWTQSAFHPHDIQSDRFFITCIEANLSKCQYRNQLIILTDPTTIKLWGLPAEERISQEGVIRRYYYFVSGYSNLMRTPNTRKRQSPFGHGGLSPFEIMIPFAIIQPKSEEKTIKPQIVASIEKTKIIIKNDCNKVLTNILIEIIFQEKIFRYLYEVLKINEFVVIFLPNVEESDLNKGLEILTTFNFNERTFSHILKL